MKHFCALMAKLIAKIHFPYTHKLMCESECLELIGVLQDGDVILTHTSGELSNAVLNHFGHAGLVNNKKIYEATTLVIKKTDPMFFLSRKDDVIVLRPRLGLKLADMNYFLEENLGRSYDFEFESNDGQFYCFELVAEALKMCSNLSIDTVKTPLGKQFLAKSFLTSEFEIVWKRKNA